MDRISLDDLFDRRLDFPDIYARKRFVRLVGVDEAKSRLTKLLAVLVNPPARALGYNVFIRTRTSCWNIWNAGLRLSSLPAMLGPARLNWRRQWAMPSRDRRTSVSRFSH